MKTLARILLIAALVCVLAGIWSNGPATWQFIATGGLLAIVGVFMAASAWGNEQSARREKWRKESLGEHQ